MKFSYKLIASCLISTSVIFSLGASLMIYQNHEHLLTTTLKEKENAHILRTFSLESKLIQDAKAFDTNYGENEEVMDQRATYYVKQYASLSPLTPTSYILQKEQGILLFASAEQEVMDRIKQQKPLDTLWKTSNHIYATSISTILVANRTYTFYTLTEISPIYEERTRQYQSFLFIDVCMLVISFFLLYIISTYLTKPIKRLHDASKRIASGHYEERCSIKTNDEIGALSISFDEMAEATETTIKQLKESLASKEEFMGSFSHEIKTPMTAIIGFADMLRTYDCDSQTKKEAISYIYNESKRLEQLSQTLMELLSLSHEPPELTQVSMHALSEKLIMHYKGLGSLKQLQIAFESATVYGNEALLFTLLRNLIDNALKATPANETITIASSIEGSHYTISIIDHGIGMSEEELSKAQQPFYMADQSRARHQGGAGLGLSIVTRICEYHHCELQITSKKHVGTTVCFTLEVISDEEN